MKTGSGGRTRWFQLFWACTKCGSLNRIILPFYRVERASIPLPTALATGVVNALQEGPLDLDELTMRLRKTPMQGVRHVFNSDVLMVLEFLKGRGVIAEDTGDRTAKVLDAMRDRPTGSTRLGPCPAELGQGIERRALVSVYAQRQIPSSQGMRLVSVGVVCLSCQYRRIEM